MTELVDVLEAQYVLKLEHHAKQWERDNPEEAKALREKVTAEFKIAGQPEPEPGSLRWHVFEQDVVEKIRVLNGWRTVRQWMLKPEIASQLAAPFVPPKPKIVPPVVDRFDHKAASAGERE